jgi:hypothetical protein
MAAAVVIAGVLRATLPERLRVGVAPWLLLTVLGILLVLLVIADPGRIDRPSTLTRGLTDGLIALISLANASSAARLVSDIITNASGFNNANLLLRSGGAIWLTNVIAFSLWYWDLDRGGAAARATNSAISPAFVFPEMTNTDYVAEGWTPHFIDYFALSFSTAMAFSPTDVSAIKPWAKILMMMEQAISLVVALLVVARAVNILN